MKGKTIFKGFAVILILLLALSVLISCKPEPKAPEITASQSETAKGVVTAFFEGPDGDAVVDIGISCGLTANAKASFTIGEGEYSIDLKIAELSMAYKLKDDGDKPGVLSLDALKASADLTGPSAEAGGEPKTSSVLVDIKSEDLISGEPGGTITVNGEAIELAAEDAIENIVNKIGIDVSPFSEDDFDFGAILSESLAANASGTLKKLDFEIKTKINGKDAELSLSANGDLSSAGTSFANGKRTANVKGGMNVDLRLRVGEDSISFKASLKEDKSINDLEAWINGLDDLFDDDEDSKLAVFEEYVGLSIKLTEAKVNNAAVDPDSLLNALIET